MISNIQITDRLRIRPYFKWFDLWVGIYIDNDQPALYFGFFPTLGLKFYFEKVAKCPHCEGDLHKEAHHGGDGWYLGWACSNPDCESMGDTIGYPDWPWASDRAVSAKELREKGFLIV